MAHPRLPILAPRLAGLPLQVTAALAENPLLARAIHAQMVSQLHLGVLRDARLEEAPLGTPRVPVPQPHNQSTSAVNLSDLDAPHQDLTGYPPLTAAALTQAYRSGSITPTQVAGLTTAGLEDQEHAHHPPMRAMVLHQPKDLMAQATASEERWRAGKPLGPLDGVPVAVKDELHLRGYATSVGTAFMATRTGPATLDATAVARLRAAGALLVGKTNMHELGMGVTGINPHHGAARNPHDPTRFTGGSSSGSAAAVASGLVPLAVGADGGGSIRIPAALCGVVGLKPTWGRVSEHGAAPLCWSVAHVGPLGATVRDVALGYALMAGPDELDPTSLLQPDVNLDGFAQSNLTNLRLGVWTPWFEDAHPSVVKACWGAVVALKSLGATVVEVELPDPQLVRLAHLVIIASEMALARATHYPAPAHHYGGDVRLNMALAQGLSSQDHLKGLQVRERACRHMERVFEKVDVVLTPTTACTAGLIALDTAHCGEANMKVMEALMRFVVLGNLTGLPALSLPVGYDPNGLPIGLQLLARPWEEALLLRVAHAAEPLFEKRKPAVHHALLEV